MTKLTDNPLIDDNETPTRKSSVLDIASALIADQISEYKEKVTEAVSHIGDQIEKDTKAAVEEAVEEAIEAKIPTQSSTMTYRNNPFKGPCPKLNISENNQLLVSSQWNRSRDNWSVYTGSLLMHTSDSNIQEMIFSTALNMIEDLDITDVVTVLPVTQPHTAIYQLIRKDESNGNSVLEIVNSVANMKIRPYECHWDITDKVASKYYDDDFIRVQVTEIARILTRELYHIVLNHLRSTPHKVDIDFVNNKQVTLELYKECSLIAQRSTRGHGNVMIAACDVVAALINEGAIEVKNDDSKRHRHIQFVGTFKGMEIFIDTKMPRGEAVMHYMGKASVTDGGVYFIPKNVLISGGASVNPAMFNTTIQLYNEYDIVNPKRRMEDGELVDAIGNYVSHINIANIPYTVEDDAMLTGLFENTPIPTSLVNTKQVFSPYQPLNIDRGNLGE